MSRHQLEWIIVYAVLLWLAIAMVIYMIFW